MYFRSLPLFKAMALKSFLAPYWGGEEWLSVVLLSILEPHFPSSSWGRGTLKGFGLQGGRGFLFPRLLAAPLIPVIAAIFVERYLDIGLGEDSRVGQMKAEIADVETALHPHAFVVGLDGEQGRAL